MSSLFPMRTTLNLDDDVLSVVKQYAETRSVGLGKAVSELVRRGIAAPVPTRTINGLLILIRPRTHPRSPQKGFENWKLKSKCLLISSTSTSWWPCCGVLTKIMRGFGPGLWEVPKSVGQRARLRKQDASEFCRIQLSQRTLPPSNRLLSC